MAGCGGACLTLQFCKEIEIGLWSMPVGMSQENTKRGEVKDQVVESLPHLEYNH
jgi:hypothetical protein